MSKAYSDLIANIHAHQFFNDFRKDLLTLRPIVPAFDEKADNTEQWKADSMKQQGFDLVLKFLHIKE